MNPGPAESAGRGADGSGTLAVIVTQSAPLPTPACGPPGVRWSRCGRTTLADSLRPPQGGVSTAHETPPDTECRAAAAIWTGLTLLKNTDSVSGPLHKGIFVFLFSLNCFLSSTQSIASILTQVPLGVGEADSAPSQISLIAKKTSDNETKLSVPYLESISCLRSKFQKNQPRNL